MFRDLVVVVIHVYGSIHQMLELPQGPWLRYPDSADNVLKKWSASTLFSLIVLLVAMPIQLSFWPGSVAFFASGSIASYMILFTLITAFAVVDYRIMYESRIGLIFRKTFLNESNGYKVAVYVLDLILIVIIALFFMTIRNNSLTAFIV
jgi:hypothetical protein